MTVNTASTDKILESIESELDILSRQNISFEQAIEILKKRKQDKEQKTIPLSIFKNEKLSALEAIVKYLRENLNLGYKEISVLLGRNYNPIRITYKNSLRKLPKKFAESSSEKIPLEIFRNSKLSVLESISVYMKDSLKLNYHQIAILLNRDDRTIWTVCQRAIKKRKGK